MQLPGGVRAIVLGVWLAAGGVGIAAQPECASADPLRNPYFGDLHVHTAYSADAYVFDVFERPRAAYAFAKGAEIGLPPYQDGAPTRRLKLRQPLDFAAVTDHSEGFGYMMECTDVLDDRRSANLAWQSPSCRIIRGEVIGPTVPLGATIKLLYLLPNVIFEPPIQYESCYLPEADCNPTTGGAPLWEDIKDAADGANDPCTFTAFKAYEYTATPYFFNQHRNIIFRDEAPNAVLSYYDTESSDEDVLLQGLQKFVDDGFDLVSIPHNSNLSGGFMFPDPKSAEEARRRNELEPLIEIVQHKGQSECRWDRRFNAGVDTTDELCAFEQPLSLNLAFGVPAPPPQLFPRRAFVRNTLKDGLRLESQYGVNPYKFGFVGSTDTHNSTPGATDERDFEGHAGLNDNQQPNRVGNPTLLQWNPGGLAVAWAEENTRDSIFAALRRRETYGTSGNRPIVRFFGGFELEREGEKLCEEETMGPNGSFAKAYDRGVPMGGDLSAGSGAPRFLVWAARDNAVETESGEPDPGIADLQRIQIVKGSIGTDGNPREMVYNVAGDPDTNAWVDEETCVPKGPGFKQLCTVWTDPDFKPEQKAFYYARVLENPSCRWSTRQCQQLGVNPFDPECAVQAASYSPGKFPTALCCAHEPLFEKVIQERAWTSPIWYAPPVS